jgi:hypothetical protein
MNHRSFLPALAISLSFATAVATAAGTSGSSGREIQQWTGKEGEKSYGDAPPAEAIKNGRKVLNPQGVPVREFPAQKTPEEAAAQLRKQQEESRRKAQDSFLLTTYTKVSDIERVRDDQLALIDSQIELSRGSLAASEQRLDSVQKRMVSFRPYSSAANARPLPDKLAGEAIQVLGERRSMQETLVKHEQRKEETRAKFDADIARYRELTSRPSIR